MDEKEKSQENVAPEVQAEQVDSESKNNGVEADSEMTRKVIFSLFYSAFNVQRRCKSNKACQ